MKINNVEIGKKGEEIASNYLESIGYIILERNFRSKLGEIDIIARIDNILVFLEVKSRNSRRYGNAYEAVDYRKQDKIRRSSLLYLMKPGLDQFQPRYDVVEVYFKEKLINHIENAF